MSDSAADPSAGGEEGTPAPAAESAPAPASKTAEGNPVIAIAVVGAILLAHILLMQSYFRDLWARPHYQFFPLAFLGAAWLMRERGKSMGKLTPGNGWIVAGLLVGEAAVLGSAALLGSSWVGMFAVMLLLLIGFYAVGGKALLYRWLPIWALLWITVRPPLSLDLKLVTKLQFLTSRWGSMVLDAFGIIHRTTGNILLMPKGEFFVEEACSGINSLLTILTATLFYVVWRRWGYIRSTLLIGAAVVWVLIANLARVVGVAVLSGLYEIPVDKGIAHEIYGMLLFCGTLGLLWSTDSFYAAVLPEVLLEERPALADRGATTWNRSAGLSMAHAGLIVPLFLGLFAIQAVIMVRSPSLGDANAPAMVKEDFPAAIGPWRQTDFESPERELQSLNYGKHSRIWSYQYRDLAMRISFDYPFAGWHDLSICYSGEGWNIVKQDTQPFDPKDPASGSVVELQLEKHGRYAAVYFVCFDARPKPLTRPETEIGRLAHWGKLELRYEALKRVMTGEGDEPLVDNRQTFQAQVMLHSFKKIGDRQRQQAAQLVRTAFMKIKSKWDK